MQSAVETLSPTRVRLTVDVPFEDLKKELDSAYKKIGALRPVGYGAGAGATSGSAGAVSWTAAAAAAAAC